MRRRAWGWSPRASHQGHRASRRLPPEAVDAEVEAVFVKLARRGVRRHRWRLQRLRLLRTAIVDREEQGETLSASSRGVGGEAPA